MEAKYPKPSKELLMQVRAAFVLKGTSFNGMRRLGPIES